MKKIFAKLEERLVYENRWIEFYDDLVLRPDGKEGTYIRLKYRGNPVGVVIIPLRPDKRMLLIRVNRYSIGKLSIEFPRGGGKIDEDIIVSARRELKQETGIEANKMSLIGYLHPDNAIMMTKVAVIVANIPSDANKIVKVNPNEAIENAEFFDIPTVWQLVANGEIMDGFTLGALALYQSKQNNQ